MFNVGGGEFLVIMLVALIVLGPAKLPEVAKQMGAMARELRRISSGFQQELKSALDEPIEDEARERGRNIVSSEQRPAPTPSSDSSDSADEGPSGAHRGSDSEPLTPYPSAASEPSATDAAEPPMSTAEAAGMYDIAAADPSSDEPDPA